MTYHKEEYTLHNGKKVYALYDDHNVCQITKDSLEMLLDLYQQGRTEAIEECNKKLDELERNYQSCYGTKIIEMYADVYEDFRAWLKEQEK